MRLLVVAEDAPDRSPDSGNGSSMITANVLPLLARTVEVDLAFFDDRRRLLDLEVEASCRRVLRLPVRGGTVAELAGMTLARVPRATWRRTAPEAVEALADAVEGADAVWAHGLHTFPAVCAVLERLPAARRPRLLVHEIDPWARHWRLRAGERRGPHRWYDLLQARLAARVERRTAALADVYVVVSPTDAAAYAQELGRAVVGIPNGVAVTPAAVGPLVTPAVAAEPGDLPARAPRIGFLGTLGYPPNVEAVQRLVGTVLPRVAAQVPDVEVHLAGRRPVPEVTALAGGPVVLHGAVDSPADFFRSLDVVVFPGDMGTGTKNTLSEALTAGGTVVASRYAARGVPDEGQLVMADTDEQIADEVVALLGDPARRALLGQRAAAWGTSRLPSWEDAATAFAHALALPTVVDPLSVRPPVGPGGGEL